MDDLKQASDWSDWVEAASNLVRETDDTDTGIFVLRMGRQQGDPHVIISNFGEDSLTICSSLVRELVLKRDGAAPC